MELWEITLRTMVREMTICTTIQAEALSPLKLGLINFHGDWSICQRRGVWHSRREWYLGLYYRLKCIVEVNEPPKSGALIGEIKKTDCHYGLLVRSLGVMRWARENSREDSWHWSEGPTESDKLKLDHPSSGCMLVVGIIKHRQKVHMNLVRLHKAWWELYITSLSLQMCPLTRRGRWESLPIEVRKFLLMVQTKLGTCRRVGCS